jgi:2-aminoadipate transaminase
MNLTTAEMRTFAAARDMETCLAEWARHLERSMLRKLIGIIAQPGVLSFAGGLPAPELFPTQDFAAAVAEVLATDPRALQYGPPLAELKSQIVELMARRGLTCREEEVLITTGAQQALNILAHLLLDPGGEVLLEEMVYSGIQQAVAPLQPRILTVTTDLERGIDVEAIAEWLAAGHQPAFIYAIPDSHNPLGVSLGRADRDRLVALAARYGVPIVEDDPYGFLSFDGPALPPLRSLNGDWVFYVGSFSKIIAPALRLGWIVAPEELLHRLTVIKESGDLESSAFTQRAVSTYIRSGRLPAHIDRLRQEYCSRRDAMLVALAATFPENVRWTNPAGGMFIWVELPKHVDTVCLLEASLARENIAFVPGVAFAVPGSDAGHCLRLSFSNVSPERITDGIARLSSVVREFV